MKQQNRINAAMRDGRKAYGYGLTFPAPWVMDILSKLDIDYVFIDGEHGPFDLERLEYPCRAAERYHLTTLARVPDIGSSHHSALSRSRDHGHPWASHRYRG
jgi:4-hydroxy-2-oxoheptanedioate aldolase